MQKIFIETDGRWTLHAADGHILHRIGSDDYTPLRHASTPDPDAWEEIAEAEAASITAARSAEVAYKARIIALIRARYDQDDETAILRQRDTKPDEFAAYNVFVEACKAQAKAEAATETTETTK